MTTSTLHARLLEVAGSRPDDLAVIHGERRLTFGELAGRIRRTAALLAAATVAGDRVAVVGANHVVWIDLYYGAPAAGRMLTMLNHRLAGAELAEQVARTRASLVIGDDAALARLSLEALPDVQARSFTDWDASISSGEEAVDLVVDGPAWLIFTSGTTARPKGAVLSHRGLLAAVAATAVGRPVADDAVYLFPFPLCHVAGYNVLSHHLAGRPVVLLDRFAPDAFVEAVERTGATSASLAATMLHDLLDHLQRTGDVDRLRTLRSIAYGAAPMPPALLRRADTMLGVEFWQGYGMTELSGNAVFLPPGAHREGLAGDDDLLRSAGWPAPGVEIKIVDAAGRTCAIGQPGEILVRATQVFEGYWEDAAATAAALVDGWLRTGDVGVRDATGLLRIVDRVKDVIVTGGENVSSLEVEDAIRACAGVNDVAVVGVPDSRWGEAVCAVVVPDPGTPVDRERIVAGVRASLAGFKVPRHIFERSDLPRNASGKVVKAELRAWAAVQAAPIRRRLLLIGIGPGDPSFVTAQAAAAIADVDAFIAFDKGDSKADLLGARRAVLDRFAVSKPSRTLVIDDGVRDPDRPYGKAVARWHLERVEAFERVLVADVGEHETVGILIWGDPSLYDSALRIVDQINSRGRVSVEHTVFPGISSVQVLTSRHRIPLNRIGGPVQITTGRLLRERPPDGVDDLVVMLDADTSFTTLIGRGWEIFWGAYLGSPDELLVAGRLDDVADEIVRVRAEARAAKGWMFDIYLLRRLSS